MKLSKSKVNTYLQCPRRFKYENIDNLPQPSPEKGSALDIGLAIHKIFELFVKQYSNKEIENMSIDDINNALMQYDRASEFKNHLSHFADFIYDCFAEGFRIYTAEYYIHNLKYNLSGLADLVLIKDGELVVVDYKTGKTGGVKKYLLELSYYVVLLEDEFELPVSYVGIFFTRDNNFRFAKVRGEINKGTLLTQEDINASLKLLDFINNKIKENNFQPNRQFLCKYCPYKPRCSIEGGF
jgi:CRISPR/Cas system-associated exonuclease Cas4 (RecB family)